MRFQILLREAREGSQPAMNELLERIYPRVCAVVHRQLESARQKTMRRLLATYSTGDVVQEIFIKVLNGLDGFAGDDEETLINYLGVLVRNTLADRLRYFTADRRDSGHVVDNLEVVAASDSSPLNRVSASEQVRLYRVVLRTFPEREQRLLRLRIEGSVPFAILAKELAYPSEDATRKAYNTARSRLLVRLQNRGVRSSAIVA